MFALLMQRAARPLALYCMGHSHREHPVSPGLAADRAAHAATLDQTRTKTKISNRIPLSCMPDARICLAEGVWPQFKGLEAPPRPKGMDNLPARPGVALMTACLVSAAGKSRPRGRDRAEGHQTPFAKSE